MINKIPRASVFCLTAVWLSACAWKCDGTLGYLAGADYRFGRESKAETGESLAAEKAGNFTPGTSNLWASLERDTASATPRGVYQEHLPEFMAIIKDEPTAAKP